MQWSLSKGLAKYPKFKGFTITSDNKYIGDVLYYFEFEGGDAVEKYDVLLYIGDKVLTKTTKANVHLSKVIDNMLLGY